MLSLQTGSYLMELRIGLGAESYSSIVYPLPLLPTPCLLVYQSFDSRDRKYDLR